MSRKRFFPKATAVAGYEWHIMLRNRWLAAFAVLFAVLSAFMFFWENSVFQSRTSVGFSRQTEALFTIMLQLTPLMSLLISSLSISAERKDGMTNLLRTYPLTLSQYVVGKFFGLFGAFFCALLSGVFVVNGLISLLAKNNSVFSQMLSLLLPGIFLTGIFTAIGLWIGSRVASRLSAVAGSLIIWFTAVYVYGMVMIVGLPYTPEGVQKPLLVAMLLLNPIETIRTGSVFWRGEGYIYGPDFYYWGNIIRSPLGIAASIILVILYMAVPLLFTVRRLKWRV
ncbi:ABC transporter permease [Aneurinibacillus terranovensis]|uniref:ABC transporter permease n=1 Tax=Aneurinibacillus terranovensis TaxID=278991 RepID=UPI00041E970E|nr:ABC transporter permease subunit [Aneurinibacillus terranovensis]